MSGHCENYRKILEDMLAQRSSPEDEQAVQLHVAECAHCRKYQKSLESDDRLLAAFAHSMNGLASRIEDGVMRAPAEEGPVGGTHRPSASILRSPVARVAVAAIVIVTIAIVSLLVDTDSTRNVVWAEVFEKIEKAPGHIVRSKWFHDGRIVHEYVRYFSPVLGFRRDKYVNGTLVHQHFVNLKDGMGYGLNFAAEVYSRSSLTPWWYERLQDYDVMRSINKLKRREHVSLGLNEIEGTMTYGIEVADTSRSGRVVKTRLYVDAETQWPVLWEIESLPKRTINCDYQWQPQLTVDDFRPTVPDDFFVADLDVPIDVLFARAIQGLRNFARITGRYPQTLDMESLRAEVTVELEKLDQAGMRSQEIADSLDTILDFGVLIGWRDDAPDFPYDYEIDDYEPSVTPADSGKVLLSREVRDQIRVIYGDLRYETVTLERLEELREQE